MPQLLQKCQSVIYNIHILPKFFFCLKKNVKSLISGACRIVLSISIIFNYFVGNKSSENLNICVATIAVTLNKVNNVKNDIDINISNPENWCSPRFAILRCFLCGRMTVYSAEHRKKNHDPAVPSMCECEWGWLNWPGIFARPQNIRQNGRQWA